MEQLANLATSTTTGSVSGASNPVTFTVTSATAFPSAGNFRVIIDNEILLVTSVSGANFTAARAQEGTSIASHLSGATVTHVLTAGAIRAVHSDYLVMDTFANLPTVGKAGRFFQATDSYLSAIDDGTNWNYRAFGNIIKPPASAGWSWVNQGSATVDQTTGTMRLECLTTNGSSFSSKQQVRTCALTAPFSVIWGFNPFIPILSGVGWCGPVFRQSSSGKFYAWRFQVSSNQFGISLEFYNSATSLAATPVNYTNCTAICQPMYIKMVDDNTNIKWYLSPDPNYFPLLLFSESRTTRFTGSGDQIGIHVNPYAEASAIDLFHLSEF